MGLYIATICGNILNYVGQSPDGLFALVNLRAVENQLLILWFLPYWAKHRVMGTIIILLVPITALGGRWAFRSFQRDNKQHLEQQIFQEVLESLASAVVIELDDASRVTFQVRDEDKGRGHSIEVSEVKSTVYPVDDNLSVEEEGLP